MQSNRIESNRPKGAAKRLECLDGLVCDKPPSLDDSDLADETELRRSPTEFRRAAVGRLGPLHSVGELADGIVHSTAAAAAATSFACIIPHELCENL